MRRATALLLCGLLAAPALASIDSAHYGSMSEVYQHVVAGFDFFARGDTEQLRMTRAVPPEVNEMPFTLWNNGIAHGFKVVYNAGGVAGISIDDLYTVDVPVTINPETNGLLVTAFVEGADRSVRLDNLKITLPGFTMYDVGDSALAPAPDYMLLTTDLPLTGGFILSGTVTFSWTGALAPRTDQWFEVAPVVTPEPASGLLALAGAALSFLRPRR